MNSFPEQEEISMGIKGFSVMDLGKAGLIKPEQLGYKDSLDIIKDESFRIQKSFIKIGWYLKHIRDNELYKEEGYANICECAADQLGYSQSTVSRLINICEKFSKNHNSPEIDVKYQGFDKSQMIEMLSIEPELLERITPDMTVKQIRDMKLENKTANLEEPEKDIPGQTSIEKDFPEYMPEKGKQEETEPDFYATSHKEEMAVQPSPVDDGIQDKPDMIIDGEYREIEEPEPEEGNLENKGKEKVQSLFADDLMAAKYILEQEKKTLDEILGVGGLPEMMVLRQKIIVAALEDFIKLKGAQNDE